MNRLNKVWKTILRIWKDAVFSKLIAAGLILLITTAWAKYSNYSITDIYNFLIKGLTFKLPIFVFLSIIAIYFLIKLVIRLLRKKTDPIWDEQVGNYKFKELYQILSSQNFAVETGGMKWTGHPPPDDDLLNMFYTYYIYFNKGINIDDNLGDGGYLYGALAPKFVGYGLLEKFETKDLEIDVMITTYKISDDGKKFYSLIEKSIHLLPTKKSPNR